MDIDLAADPGGLTMPESAGDSPSHPPSASLSKASRLVKWAKLFGTTVHDHVEIYEDLRTGLSLRATQDIDPSAVLVGCSYETSLSYLNAIDATSSFARRTEVPLPAAFLEGFRTTEPNVIGHYFLMQQYLLGENSHWWSYIELLPDPTQRSLPTLWTAEDLGYLQGTNVEPSIKERKLQWLDQWQRATTICSSCESSQDWSLYTLELYQWAASIFGSRSFQPSLTIPQALVEESKDGPLISQHQKNEFSVLFPVLDLGNHDGHNVVSWVPDASGFLLQNSEILLEGQQIFNYYGSKSNSELLAAYGFILPDKALDRVELKLTPSPRACRLRRAQLSHGSRLADTPEEFRYQLSGSSRPEEPNKISMGLLDTLSCMATNKREIEFIKSSPAYSLSEHTIMECLAGQLSRVLLKTLITLKEKLDDSMRIIMRVNGDLQTPSNPNQEISSKYRRNQFEVLRSFSSELTETLSGLLWSNTFCVQCRLENPNTPRISNNLEFLSIDCAYGWLAYHYPQIYNPLIEVIAEDQNEPLPLKWSVLIEAGWYTPYWIAWIYIIWLLMIREDTILSERNPFLQNWIERMNYEFTQYDDTGDFHGTADDEQTVDLLFNTINSLPLFSPIIQQFAGRTSLIRTLRTIKSFMSFIAKEECIDSPYTMVHGSQVPCILPESQEFAGQTYRMTEDPESPIMIILSKLLVIGNWDGVNGDFARGLGLMDYLLGT